MEQIFQRERFDGPVVWILFKSRCVLLANCPRPPYTASIDSSPSPRRRGCTGELRLVYCAAVSVKQNHGLPPLSTNRPLHLTI